MRLLYVTTNFYPVVGGIEMLALEMLPRLIARGHEVTAVTSDHVPDLPAEDVVAGIPLFRVDMIRALQAKDPARVMRARRRMDEIRRMAAPDVVNLHDTGPASWFELGSRAVHPAPTVVTIQTEVPEVGSGPDSTMRRVLQSADWITAVSRETLRWVTTLEPSLAARATVIPNAVPAVRSAVRPSATPSFVCLGRLVEQKGFDLAIDAFAMVHEHHPDARLTIAGEGVLDRELEEHAVHRGVADVVRFAGRVEHEDVANLLAGATAVLLPSRFEGLPLVALEAAHQARPIVASRVSGIPEVVIDGRTGILVAPEDAGALAAAMERVLREPEWAEELGRGAREHVEAEYSIDAVTDAYEATYQRVRGPGLGPR